jgi:hypothetical protein
MHISPPELHIYLFICYIRPAKKPVWRLVGPRGQPSNRATCLACSFREWLLVLVGKRQLPKQLQSLVNEPLSWLTGTCMIAL